MSENPPPLDTEGFRETLLAYFRPEQAAALRLVGDLLFEYILEFRKSGPDSELPEPYQRWRAVGWELRHLAGSLQDVADTLVELEWALPEHTTRHLVDLAKRRAGKLGRMAAEFEAEVAAATAR